MSSISVFNIAVIENHDTGKVYTSQPLELDELGALNLAVLNDDVDVEEQPLENPDEAFIRLVEDDPNEANYNNTDHENICVFRHSLGAVIGLEHQIHIGIETDKENKIVNIFASLSNMDIKKLIDIVDEDNKDKTDKTIMTCFSVPLITDECNINTTKV